MFPSANEEFLMTKRQFILLNGFIVSSVLGQWPAFPQDISPEDPVPPQARRQIVPVTGIVTQLQGNAPRTQGRRESIQGSRVNVQGALNDLGATVTDKEIKISLNTDILFDFDHADLKPEAGPPLQKVAAVLKTYPRGNALIEGYTDGKGDDDYKQKLSERRAASVRAWLALHRVRTVMTTRGWGKSNPLAPNSKPDGSDDPDGRQKNRRVEITVKTG
jgi:outer membrane protein OmpA-like peptidoglycan-associated protein